jgi:hypothetical protein
MHLRESRSPRCLSSLTKGVVAVTAPSNYDDSGMLIAVDPNTLYQLATVDMVNQADVIGDAISNIVQIWNDLKVGWMGDTATEAQDFVDRWTNAVDQLFGTKDDASSGALPKIADGVDLASVNYGEAEDVVVKMFTSLIASLDLGFVQGAVGHLPHSVTPPPTRTPPDPKDGPIDPVTETAPPPQ